MIRRPYRLSARFVATVREPGRYGDGRGSGGLSLLVRRTARGQIAKSWAQRIQIDGRAHNLGLGVWPHVSLAEARGKCALNLVARGRGELVTGRNRAVPTFQEAAETVIAIHRNRVETRQQFRGGLAVDPPQLRDAKTGAEAGGPDQHR